MGTAFKLYRERVDNLWRVLPDNEKAVYEREAAAMNAAVAEIDFIPVTDPKLKYILT